MIDKIISKHLNVPEKTQSCKKTFSTARKKIKIYSQKNTPKE